MQVHHGEGVAFTGGRFDHVLLVENYTELSIILHVIKMTASESHSFTMVDLHRAVQFGNVNSVQFSTNST